MKIHSFIFAIMITLFFLSNYSFSIDCPSGEGWSSSTINYDIGYYGPGGQVDYEWRQSGSNYEIKISWNTFQNNSDFIQDEALKKILETEAVRNVIPDYPYHYEWDVYVYFVRDCNVKVKCVLELVRSAEVTCSDQSVTLCQNWYTKYIGEAQHSFYNIYKYIPCGQKCCARKYHCERWYDNAGNPQQWKTSVSLSNTLSITTCSGDSEYQDCLPPYEYLPCEDGSCDGYY